jgi:transcriptional regulator MraZ
MFWGEYSHSLDDKGRVILPVKFREPLQRGAYVTAHFDRCLAIWTPEEFESVKAQITENAKRGPEERKTARTFFARTVDVVPDRQGRIPIPPALRQFAELQREVVVTGQNNRIEIWNPERWRAVHEEGERSLSDGGAHLSDFGI